MAQSSGYGVRPVRICIDVPIKSDDLSLSNPARFSELRDIYDRDAEAVVSALLNSLPGGTTDRVLSVMLRRKSSILRVPDLLDPDQPISDEEFSVAEEARRSAVRRHRADKARGAGGDKSGGPT